MGQLCAETDESGNSLKIKFDHGTTTLGFMYQNGIILAVDSRATGGMFIGKQQFIVKICYWLFVVQLFFTCFSKISGSGEMKKIVEINDYLLGTLAGGAADCVYWDRVLAKQCRMYELRNRSRISVAAASKLMSNMVYNYKGMGLSIGNYHYLQFKNIFSTLVTTLLHLHITKLSLCIPYSSFNQVSLVNR